MSFEIFNGKTWKEITREERYFCAELYFQIRSRPNEFIRWLHDEVKLPCISEEDLKIQWEAGFEVCFYRDYIHSLTHKGLKSIREVNQKHGNDFSEKRTFDLCLLSDKKIIIIEAKAQQPFDGEQVMIFKKDIEQIRALLERDIKIEFIALASDIFFKKQRKIWKEA
jgi:hypothetical protein